MDPALDSSPIPFLSPSAPPPTVDARAYFASICCLHPLYLSRSSRKCIFQSHVCIFISIAIHGSRCHSCSAMIARAWAVAAALGVSPVFCPSICLLVHEGLAGFRLLLIFIVCTRHATRRLVALSRRLANSTSRRASAQTSICGCAMVQLDATFVLRPFF